MQKFAPYIFVLLLVACIAACGGSGTATTAATPIYSLPAPVTVDLSNPRRHLGGAVQGTTLNLSNTVSPLAGNPVIAAPFVPYSSATGAAVTFNQPNDVTTDGINFYVADYANNAVHQVTSGVVTTLRNPVTKSYLSFNRPSGITVDDTNIYVVANGSNTVNIINKGTKEVTTIGSIGLAGSVDSTVPADVRFNQPTGITTDGVNLYVTDSGNHTIRRIDIISRAVSTLAGTSGAIGSTGGTQADARFNLPWRITTDGASLYLTDFRNRTIRQIVLSTGLVTTIAGSPGPLSADNGTLNGIGTAARFYHPNGITTDGTYLYVTDSYHNTIRRIDKSAPYNVVTIPVPGSSLHTPLGITTDGTSLFVVDTSILNEDKTYTYSNRILNIQ